MPYTIGCCCVTPCEARNAVRYQYRIKGNNTLQSINICHYVYIYIGNT